MWTGEFLLATLGSDFVLAWGHGLLLQRLSDPPPSAPGTDTVTVTCEATICSGCKAKRRNMTALNMSLPVTLTSLPSHDARVCVFDWYHPVVKVRQSVRLFPLLLLSLSFFTLSVFKLWTKVNVLRLHSFSVLQSCFLSDWLIINPLLRKDLWPGQSTCWGQRSNI